MRNDLLFALRLFRRRPIVAATVILTLALAIGVCTAAFSIIDSVLLHPVAAADPDRLMAVLKRNPSGSYGPLTLAAYRRVATDARDFERTAAFTTINVTVSSSDAPDDIAATLTSPEYFRTLGVAPALGRVFTSRDSIEGTWNQEVVLSSEFWQSHFGGSSNVVGRPLVLNGISMVIIGVMPNRFRGTSLSSAPDVWLPLVAAPVLGIPLLSNGAGVEDRIPVFSVVGRLRAGAIESQTARNLPVDDGLGSRERSESSGVGGLSEPVSYRILPVNQNAIAGDNRSRMVLVLTSISALVATALLLACLNIASILMALGARRATEFGLRLALGASSRQLYRQVLTESLLLSVAGTVAGFGTAVSVERLAAHLALPGGISLDRLDLHLSAHTLAFTAAVTIMTTLLIGILPARQAARASVAGAIRFRHQTVTSWRTVLLSAQMAISLAVLVGAGLFLRSVHAGLGADLGFAAKPLAILSARARLDGRHLDVIQPYMQMVKSASAVPGIQAALSSHVPLESTWQLPSFAGLPSAAPVSQNTPTMIGIESITPNYFRVLGVPLVSGREFDDRDTPVAQRVAIINETAARVLFPGQSALGKAITLGPVFTYTVVGIVRDTKYATLQDEAIPFAYQPMLQGDLRGRVHVVTRSDNPQRALEILRQLAKLNAPQLKSVRLELELDRIATVLHPQRVGALLLSVLALAALCIAAIGTYGSVAYLVSQRTTEIGIRLALGARSIDVTILVLQQCGVALASGIICGVVISAVAGRFVAHFLFEVQPMDIVALFGAVAVLSVTSLIAAAAPVLRALRIDPVSAMRSVD